MARIVHGDTIIVGHDGSQFRAREGAYAGWGWGLRPDGNVEIPEHDDPLALLPGGAQAHVSYIAAHNQLNQPTPAAPKPPPPNNQTQQQDPADRAARRAANRASILALLRRSRLEELIRFLDQWVVDDLNGDQVEALLYDWDSEPGKVVDRLYPALRRRKEAGLKPGSIAENLAYRSQARHLLSQRGVLTAFPDPLAKADEWYGQDLALTEQDERLEGLTQYVAGLIQNDPETQADLEAMHRYYGVRPTLNDMVAMAINRDHAAPVVRRRLAAVAADAAASRTGFGDLTLTEAERIAGLGFDRAGAAQRFGALVDARELMDALPGWQHAEDTISREEQLGAAFEGNANAQRRIERRARQRAAAGQGGGGFATSTQGLVGFGSAR